MGYQHFTEQIEQQTQHPQWTYKQFKNPTTKTTTDMATKTFL